MSAGQSPSSPGAGDSYYEQPVIKEPVWTWEIPCYFFTGGIAGAGAGLAYVAHLRGNDVLERRAWAISLGGVTLSPLLLISDLGKPTRFLNMLRMFKVTSPMSVGSWILVASGATIALASADAMLGALPRAARAARPGAALLGMPLATYTAALISNTAIPVWHEARRELPFLFAAGSAASAGGLACVLTPCEDAGPARRLAIAGALGALLATRAMERRLGELAEPYEQGHAGRFSRIAKVAMAAGGALMLTRARRSRRAAAVAGGALLAGAFCERWSVFRAGFQSAADPRQVIGPQRERVRRGSGRGASISVPAASRLAGS
jgi:formate-dependent nitrite reductase membrane component NrfD